MISSTAAAKPPPAASVNSGWPEAPAAAPRRSGRGSMREGERDDRQAEQRRGDDPQGDRGLAAGDPDGDRERERDAGRGLGQQEGGVEGEAPAAGQKAAREEAGAEGEHGGDQDPVQGLVAGQEVVLERASQGEGAQTAKAAARPSWIVAATRSGWPIGCPCAWRSAIVRESSCSTGRKRVEMVMKTADHSTTTSP